MLDTGATINILNEETWRNSGTYCPEHLEPLDPTLTMANGESLPVQGRVPIKIRLGNLTLTVPMVIVQGVSQPVILGSDFFRNHGCRIAYDTGTFLVRKTEVPIHFQKCPPTLCRVVLWEKVQFDPGTEVVISAKLENGYERNNGTPGMVEDKRSLGTNAGICMAPSLTVPVGDLMTVRLANFADKSTTLKPGKVLGYFHPLHHDFGSVNSFSVAESMTNAPQETDEMKY